MTPPRVPPGELLGLPAGADPGQATAYARGVHDCLVLLQALARRQARPFPADLDALGASYLELLTANPFGRFPTPPRQTRELLGDRGARAHPPRPGR